MILIILGDTLKIHVCKIWFNYVRCQSNTWYTSKHVGVKIMDSNLRYAQGDAKSLNLAAFFSFFTQCCLALCLFLYRMCFLSIIIVTTSFLRDSDYCMLLTESCNSKKLLWNVWWFLHFILWFLWLVYTVVLKMYCSSEALFLFPPCFPGSIICH